jgi:hypothetical protein
LRNGKRAKSIRKRQNRACSGNIPTAKNIPQRNENIESFRLSMQAFCGLFPEKTENNPSVSVSSPATFLLIFFAKKGCTCRAGGV